MPLEDLQVWQKATRLSIELYKHFSNHRDFGFRDQITRSGLSIASNIAEGHERPSRKDFARFLAYAKGSTGELRTQIHIGVQIGYIAADTGKRWSDEAHEISCMITGLVRSQTTP